MNVFQQFIRRIAKHLEHKRIQTRRLSRKTLAFVFLLMGASFVALTSLAFALMADFAMLHHAKWASNHPFWAVALTPLGLMLAVWLMRRYAPYVGGSGIPQVTASLVLAEEDNKKRLLNLPQTILKIPLTFIAMLVGASVGREGPSVQVGASVMYAWGSFCRRHRLWFHGLHDNDLIAAGAAGGLAAAFNAPLAGVIFVIEELGRRTTLHWDRYIFISILASGFILIAIMGNNPHFPLFEGKAFDSDMLLWVLLCGLASGIFGGIFARLLSRGLAAFSPSKWRQWINNHPILMAGIMGLLVSYLGFISYGHTYGAGYNIAAQGLIGQPEEFPLWLMPVKLAATVFSYWSGVAGGIFTPALTTGASLGMALWHLTGEHVDVSVTVLLCMAAFLAAATQSPLTSGVIVMEMTGSQPMLFWMLIACIFASVVSRQFCPHPFYQFMATRFIHRVRMSAVTPACDKAVNKNVNNGE